MQWFRKPPEPDQSHVGLEERLHTLSLRIDELEKAHRAVAMSVEDALDRVFHWMQRTSARTKALQAAPEPAPATGAAGDGLDPVSAKLLARRARTAPRPPADDEEG
jgi:hypothetical protein